MTTKHAETLPKSLPGAVCPQYVGCGRAGCKCGRGELHGPYYYRIWREGKRVHKMYIKRAELEAVRDACAAHEQYSEMLRSLRHERERLAQTINKHWRAATRLRQKAEKAGAPVRPGRGDGRVDARQRT